jgi:hypothetical protein
MKPLSAREALDRHYLEMRAKLLELAACLDRIDRGGGAAGDARLEQIQKAVAILGQRGDGRAERLQMHFSLPYDDQWRAKFGQSASA